MDPDEADRAIARHHRMVVNSIEAGAYDGALPAILEAERRRDSPRPNVLTTIQERIDALKLEVELGLEVELELEE